MANQLFNKSGEWYHQPLISVEDGEGFFLFDGIGVTTKEGTSLLTVCFQIPDDVAEYVAGL